MLHNRWHIPMMGIDWNLFPFILSTDKHSKNNKQRCNCYDNDCNYWKYNRNDF